MNILFLTADSLRADRTSLFDYDKNTTPFLTELAEGGFEFRRAYANGYNTASSFPAIHTSSHQSYYEGVGIAESGTPTLAEVLRENGYVTHGIHTNELVSRDYNYGRGFDEYQDSRSLSDSGNNTRVGWRQRARKLIGNGYTFEGIKRLHFFSTEYFGMKIFDTADAVSNFEDEIVNWATAVDDDWFIWAHYMNPHHPYEPPTDCQKELGFDPVPKREATKLSRKMRLHPEDVTEAERETLNDLYDASVLSWDREIRSTYEKLEKEGEMEDTLVIVSADHGELLGEAGYYGHPPVLKQPLLRVPLIFNGNQIPRGKSDSQVGLLDLAPTIATLANVDVTDNWQGQPLFNVGGSPQKIDPDLQFSEAVDENSLSVAAIDDDRKVVHEVTPDEWDTYELPDSNRLSERTTDSDFTDLQEAIRDHESVTKANRKGGAAIDRDQLKEDLAALGYLDE